MAAGAAGLERLLWDDPPRLHFAPLSSGSPTRWAETDAGASVVVNVQPTGNPLANDALAVEQIRRAAVAWTEAPESRLSVVLGNAADTFTATQSTGPADAMPPRNIVLFNDPYDDISPPSGCSGTWPSAATGARGRSPPPSTA